MSILGVATKEKRVAPVRMWIYGSPNTGKTHFAAQFPKPLLLSTDGNYVYENIPANSLDAWEVGPLAKDDQKAKAYMNILEVLKNTNTFETVILDLVEGAYRLARNHYLKVLKIVHESDLGWGKAHTTVRENFISGIEQLFKLPVNVIILSHEESKRIEPKGAAAYDVFRPKLDSYFHEIFEGYCNIVARYSLDTDADGNQVRKLSLSPKNNEYGINRLGLCEDLVITENGDNYAEFLAVWTELYEQRGLGQPAEVRNVVREVAKKDQAEGKKAKLIADAERAAALAKEAKEAKDEAKIADSTTSVKSTTSETTVVADDIEKQKRDRIAALKAQKEAAAAKEEQEVETEEETSKDVIDDGEPEVVRTDSVKEKLAKIAALKAAREAANKK